MKIDLENAKKEFIKYSEKFDLMKPEIKRKQTHSLRVMSISKEISVRLGLDEEQIQVATLIGLLHDIARFKQYTEYETFSDLRSFDHGNYGVKILENDIRKYIETDKYDEIIKKAIKNHNKFEIEDGLSEEEMLFAKIIRDADKIDIIYEATEMFWNGEEDNVNNSKISEKVWNQILDKKLIKREKNVELTGLDSVLSVLAFVYNIYFNESFEILKERNYIDKIFNRFNVKYEKTKMEEIKNIINKYIEDNIEGKD